MGREIWVVAEYDGEELTDLTKELLGTAKAARGRGRQICAVLPGSGLKEPAGQLSGYGADRVYICGGKELEHYNSEVYVSAFAEMIVKYNPLLVICGMTANGRDLGGRLSARLKSPFFPACVSLKPLSDGRYEINRLLYNGAARQTAVVGGGKTAILAFSPGARGLEEPDCTRAAEVVAAGPARPVESGVRQIGICAPDFREIDLAEADIVVSGGNGLEHEELFMKLRELGELLGAPVGGSRVAVDKGRLRRERMVGATGKTVSGRLYLAFGISGAIQHTMGIKDCGTIVAVNKDPNAPIFKIADLAAAGDASEILPLLVERLKALDLRGSGVDRE